MPKHKHYKLIKQFAKLSKVCNDPLRYFRMVDGDTVQSLTAIAWSEHVDYRITEEGLALLTKYKKPNIGDKYWNPVLTERIVTVQCNTWDNDHLDRQLFDLGWVFKTKEEAIECASQLLARAIL